MHVRKATVYLAGVIWSAALIGGYLWAIHYGFATSPPQANFSHGEWPSKSSLRLSADRPTLVLFLHPRCPCTRATVAELEKILMGRKLMEPQQPTIIAVAPLLPGVSEDWQTSDTISTVLRFPNSSLFWDRNAAESKRFGAVTSGTVMLFRPGGKRVFAGGVTEARGHEGENQNADELLAALLDENLVAHTARPVFGCPLFNEEVTGVRQVISEDPHLLVVPGASR